MVSSVDVAELAPKSLCCILKMPSLLTAEALSVPQLLPPPLLASSISVPKWVVNRPPLWDYYYLLCLKPRSLHLLSHHNLIPSLPPSLPSPPLIPYFLCLLLGFLLPHFQVNLSPPQEEKRPLEYSILPSPSLPLPPRHWKVDRELKEGVEKLPESHLLLS